MQWPGRLLPILALVFAAPAPAAAAQAGRAGRIPDPNEWEEGKDEDEPRPGTPMTPVDNAAIGVLGMYLPKTESEPIRWTLGGVVRLDYANGNEDSPYCSFGYFRYREEAVRDNIGLILSGVTTTIVPLTFGYLWRGHFVEGQFGGGLLFWSERRDEPASGMFGFGFDSPPPILPTLEAALRYRF